jgi:hypothetical protein
MLYDISMNPEKSEVKLAVLQGHGEKTEQKMEQLRLEAMATEAAIRVLTMTATEFQKTMAEVDLDTRTGKLTAAQAVIAKKYVKRCLEFSENFARGTEMKLYSIKGKMDAYKEIVDSLRADRDEEKKRLEGFRHAQVVAQEQVTVEAAEVPSPSPDVASKKSRPIRTDVARSLDIDNKRKK